MNSTIVRKCDTLEDFNACVALQREIWGESDLEIEPAGMFVVATHTGGQVLGAFDGEKLVGYTLAIAGVQRGAFYLHSHHTGVHRDYRDRGVGRLLKLFQREEALSRGIRLVQWTFDPLELRNAHFNLNRLGAISRHYEPNLYGLTTSPLHRGLATDRLLAEWRLDSPRVIAAIGGKNRDARRSAEARVKVEVPGGFTQGNQANSQKMKHAQDRIRAEFTNWFARGYAAIATIQALGGAEYLLVPWNDLESQI